MDYRAVDISFRRVATQILESMSKAPLALYRGVEKAEKAPVIKESVLWGCPGMSFKANLPFNGMRHAASSAELQFFAALLKEICTALTAIFFQSANLLLSVPEDWADVLKSSEYS